MNLVVWERQVLKLEFNNIPASICGGGTCCARRKVSACHWLRAGDHFIPHTAGTSLATEGVLSWRGLHCDVSLHMANLELQVYVSVRAWATGHGD